LPIFFLRRQARHGFHAATRDLNLPTASPILVHIQAPPKPHHGCNRFGWGLYQSRQMTPPSGGRAATSAPMPLARSAPAPRSLARALPQPPLSLGSLCFCFCGCFCGRGPGAVAPERSGRQPAGLAPSGATPLC